MPVYDLVERADATLAAAERVAVILLIGAITAIMMTQVVLRYFFRAPLFWAEEISVQFLVFVSIFGLSLLTRMGDLVSIDFVPRAFSGRAKHVLMAILGLVMLGMIAFIAWLGWDWIARPDVRIELSATTQLPRWYTYALLPVGLSCMSIHQAAAVLRHVRAAAGHAGDRS